jgi:pseudaminic acid biosynthesis-associated methylase
VIYRTEQEKFWLGDFGTEYMKRNQGEQFITTNIVQFGRILRTAPGVQSCVELGCNIGNNLAALKRINPSFELRGYELNPKAAEKARALGVAEILEGTVIEELKVDRKFDIAFTCGVLIHISPDSLDRVYENLHNLSKRYIMVFEYYNPTPIEVPYRGHQGKLFKRDFAGELMDKYDLQLVDYGFSYHRDNCTPQDDCTWFLLQKK